MAAAGTVATTRLSPPRLRWETVDRPRLLKQLIGAEAMAFVAGPAGSGKSTLLAQADAKLPDYDPIQQEEPGDYPLLEKLGEFFHAR